MPKESGDRRVAATRDGVDTRNGTDEAVGQLRASRRRRTARAVVAVLMLIGFVSSAEGSSPASAASQSCANKAYTSNSNEHTVSVIDTRTNTETATIPVGTAPINPTFSPDGRYVYVADSQGGTISVIDVSTDTVVDTLSAGGARPTGLAFTPNGKELVISYFGASGASGTVRVMTVSTGALSDPIPVGIGPERLALSPNGKTAYVVNLGSGSVTVIDLTAKEVVTTIEGLGNTPFNLLVSQNGQRLYVGVVRSNYVAVIETRTNTVIDMIESPSPNGMAFSRNRRSIFVTNVFDNTIQEISLRSGEVVRTVDAGPFPGYIEVTRDGKHAYMVRPFGNTVSVIDTATLAIVDTLTVGTTATSTPTTVAVCHGTS
jgi:YVTN family beta-propeller protein